MDPAAREWLKEYKKLFDKVAEYNAGGTLAADVGTTPKTKMTIQRIGKVVDDNAPENGNKKSASGTKAQDSGERWAINYPQFSEADINVNMKDIALMQPVKIIPEDKLKKTGKLPRDIYEDFFDSLGNNIYSPVFGDISLSKSSAKSDVGHGNWSGKIASIEAVPDVILKGKVIFHKMKGEVRNKLERIVVAAPIIIGNDDYYMGVMLQRDPNSQRLYLHNVLAIKNEEARTTSRADRVTYGAGEEDPNLLMTIILENAINVKLNDEKTLAKTPEALDSLTKSQAISLIQRGVEGDDLLNAADLAEEIKSVGGEITKDGNAVLYHGTSKVNADKINSTGKMYGKEDGLFFSTKKDGLVLDYGEAVVKVQIPLEKLVLDDVFSDEVHLRMPTRQFKYTDVKIPSDNGERSALADGKKATASDVAAAKRAIRESGIDPSGIIAVADKYFDRYGGELTRTGVRYEFLGAAETMLEEDVGAMERA